MKPFLTQSLQAFVLYLERIHLNKCQRLAQKYGREFLALLDSDHNFKVFVTDIVQKLVLQDEEGNIISQTDSSFVGKLIEVRFNSLR